MPSLFKAGSKLTLEILPSVAATVIGGYLLAQLHFGRTPDPAIPPTATVASTQEPTVGEDRAAMRQVLKARRETPEQPAQVRPIATVVPASAPPKIAPPPVAAPTTRLTTAKVPVGLDSISPREPVARPPAPNRPAVAAAAPLAPPAPQTEDEVYVPAPPPGLPPAPPRGMDAPTVIVPSVANAAVPPATAPNAPPAAPAPTEPRGPVGTVFSTFSSLVGHAANATGHTVNWVIDLPGKAISAGGRVIGVSPPPPPARPFS